MKQISYESSRDLPTEIAYATGTGTLLAKRNYTYDTLGRVAARTQTRGTETPRNDSFDYNTRSELTSATLGSYNDANRLVRFENAATRTVTLC